MRRCAVVGVTVHGPLAAPLMQALATDQILFFLGLVRTAVHGLVPRGMGRTICGMPRTQMAAPMQKQKRLAVHVSVL